MVERVARALVKRELTDLGRKAFNADVNYYFKSFSSVERASYEAQAATAIEAMREPTVEIDNVITASIHYTAAEIWEMFIDAALKE